MAPALGVTGGLLLCLIIFHQQAELSTLSTVVGLLLALTSAIAYYLHRKHYPWASPLLFACLLGAAAGWNNALWQAHQRQDDQLLPACEGIPLWADITVADLPTPIDIGIKWTGEVTHFTPTAECPRLPSRISMGWYTGFSSKTAGPPPPIHVGQVWHLPIKLKRTVAPLQFNGFDVQAYWFANQIGATGSVQARLAKSQAAVIDHRFSIGIGIEQSREFFRAHMQRALGDRPLAGVIVALVLGDQKAITGS